MSDDVESYFDTRLEYDPRRNVLWRILCDEVFNQYGGPEATVLELGAGWGDFINNVSARRKVAVDMWPGITEHLDPSIETHVGSATDLHFLDAASVDMVFASNLIEHLTHEQAGELVSESRRVLLPGGKLVLVQPNYRLCADRYFDDYTHVSVWSDVGLSDFLSAHGFKVEKCLPKFLPFSLKSRLPVSALLIKTYLRLPVKPLAGQMLLVATPAV